MANTSKKIFVLDTNVILHDATCIQNFEDNEVVIPISALEELDQFKRGNEQIHYNAREFLRLLDELSINSNSNDLNQEKHIETSTSDKILNSSLIKSLELLLTVLSFVLAIWGTFFLGSSSFE